MIYTGGYAETNYRFIESELEGHHAPSLSSPPNPFLAFFKLASGMQKRFDPPKAAGG